MACHGGGVAGESEEVGGDDVVEDLGEPGARQVEQQPRAQDLIDELHLQQQQLALVGTASLSTSHCHFVSLSQTVYYAYEHPKSNENMAMFLFMYRTMP